MISILGGGSWGLALATVLAGNDKDVLIWARDEEQVRQFNERHTSKYFPAFEFPKTLRMTNSLNEAISNSNTLVLSVPVKATIGLLDPIKNEIKDKDIVLTAKGLDKGELLSDRLKGIVSDDHLAVISGPSFASEVVQAKTTCVVIASKNEELAKRLQDDFSTYFFRSYTSNDVVGVEICGALKNVYAIGSGILDAMHVGYDTKAAYLTRSLHELGKIVVSLGGKESTLAGLSGIGDLILTCTSPTSRNYSFGLNFDGDLSTIKTVEGLNTLPNIMALANRLNIDMPIVKSIHSVVFEKASMDDIFTSLMSREKKSEGMR